MDATNATWFKSQWSKWPLIGSGIVFLFLGCFYFARHDVIRGVPDFATGFGMGFYGLLTSYGPQFRLRRLAFLIALGAWFAGAFGMIYAAF
jgi:hypothetical protein